MTEHFDIKNGVKIQQFKESTKQEAEFTKQEAEITKRQMETETTRRNKNTAIVIITVSFLFFLGLYLIKKKKK